MATAPGSGTRREELERELARLESDLREISKFQAGSPMAEGIEGARRNAEDNIEKIRSELATLPGAGTAEGAPAESGSSPEPNKITTQRRRLIQELNVTRTLRDQSIGEDRRLFDERVAEIEKQISILGQGPDLTNVRLMGLVTVEDIAIAESEASADPFPFPRTITRGIELASLLEADWPKTTTRILADGLRDALVQAHMLAVEKAAPEAKPIIGASELVTGLIVASAMRERDMHRSAMDAQRAAMDGIYLDRLLPIFLPGGTPAPVRRTGPTSYVSVLAPSAVAILAEAARIRSAMDAGQRMLGRRHVYAALLLSEAGRRELDARGLFPAGFETFRDRFAEIIDGRAGREGEKPDGWHLLAARIRGVSYRPIRPRERPQLVNDGIAGKREADRLGAAQDADALAELICLRATEPPLAIGVFGAWGSGKSSLMAMLHEAVEERVAKTRAAEADGSAKDMPEDAREVGRVVQIRFNAWTYADSDNLWASLTAEFFDQLAAGGHSNWQGTQGRQVVAEVARRLSVVTAEKTATESELTTESSRRDALRAEIGRLEEQRSKQERQIAAGFVQAQLADKEKRDALQDGIAAPFGVAREDVAGITARLDDLSHLSSRTMVALAVARRMLQGWGIGAAALLLIAIIFALFAAAVTGGRPPWLPGSAAATNLAALLAAAGAVFAFMKRVMPVLELVAAYDRHRTEEAKRLEAQLQAKRADLAASETKLRELEARRDRGDGFIRNYGAAATGRSPAALLQYFLRESADLAAVRSKLGFVATVRRCFETLQDIMREMRDAGTKDPLPQDARIDRIVLYIDDLDRCSDAQVVQVLQAIHLLLAFDLFVVVVAVDARWLSHSLRARYKDQLVEDGSTTQGKATVGDYLEKIFQIPFWVRSLQHDGSKAETLLRSIAPTVAPPAGPRPVTPAEEKKIDAPSDASGLVFVDVDEPPAAARLEHERAVRLTDAEFALASRLMPLAGRSPRALKRMINIYRLLRVMRRGGDLDRLVSGDATNPPEFPAVLFALACQTGAHPAVVARINELLALTTSDAPVSWIADALKRGTHADRTLVEALHGDPQVAAFAQALLVTAASYETPGSSARQRLEQDAARLVRLDDLASALAREFADDGSPIRKITDRRLRAGFDAVRRFSLNG